jgi:hypothetical protein
MVHLSKGDSFKKPSTSTQPIHSLADLVLSPENFSAALAASTSNAHPPPPRADLPPDSAVASGKAVPSSFSKEAPSTSIADLVLNNVTYDAILASSTKGLELESEARDFPDAPTPPNSPVLAGMGFGSLVGMSATIMAQTGK